MKRILLAIFIIPFLGCVVFTQRSNAWIKVTALDGFLASSMGTTKTAWNVLHCGRACTLDSSCQSYFFNAGKSVSNCQLHDVVFQTMSVMVPTPNLTYYIPANHSLPEFQPTSTSVSTSTLIYFASTSRSPIQTSSVETTSHGIVVATTNQEVNFSLPTFQCHPRDAQFRTVRLSDNTTYTYRFDQSYFNYSEAANSCLNQSARLARITTDAKLELFQQMLLCEEFITFQRVYVDGEYTNGRWHWYDDHVNDANFAPSFWAPGNPYDFSHACSRLAKSSQWYGENWDCKLFSPSVCEKV